MGARLGISQHRLCESYVFALMPGAELPWRPDTMNARWERARSAAGLPSVRLHDLRHFHVTQLLDAGMPVPTVAARVGHGDGTVTLRVYAHRTRRADEHAAAIIGALLGP